MFVLINWIQCTVCACAIYLVHVSRSLNVSLHLLKDGSFMCSEVRILFFSKLN